jgi:hypothetical protein
MLPVHTHVNTLKSKMNAVNVTHAVARGYELGLIELRTAEPRVMVRLTEQRPDASALIRDRQIVVSENLPVFNFRWPLHVGPGDATAAAQDDPRLPFAPRSPRRT